MNLPAFAPSFIPVAILLPAILVHCCGIHYTTHTSNIVLLNSICAACSTGQMATAQGHSSPDILVQGPLAPPQCLPAILDNMHNPLAVSLYQPVLHHFSMELHRRQWRTASRLGPEPMHLAWQMPLCRPPVPSSMRASPSLVAVFLQTYCGLMLIKRCWPMLYLYRFLGDRYTRSG